MVMSWLFFRTFAKSFFLDHKNNKKFKDKLKLWQKILLPERKIIHNGITTL